MKNRIKLIGTIALTALIVFTTAACKSAEQKANEQAQNDLIGSWRWSGTDDYDGTPVSMTFTFTKDNKFTMTQTYGSESGTGKGTYTISGSTLTVKFTEAGYGEGTETAFTFTVNNNKLTLKLNGENIPKSNAVFTKL